jgi:phosphatidate cytidylyltransferase
VTGVQTCALPIFVGLALIVSLLSDALLGAAWPREILTAALVVSLVAAIFSRSDGWLVSWGLTLAGALYIGVLGAYFILVRALPNGATWTGLVLLTGWTTDTGAYIAGTRFGHHGFFTSISPKKTWEGAIGGWVAATIVMLLLGVIVGLPPLHGLALGIGIGVASTLGDLAESLIKRQVGAKDSGAILPGHGGILDRVDSLLFAAVFAYYYLIWILHV